MKTIRRTFRRLTVGVVLAFSLISNVYAQIGTTPAQFADVQPVLLDSVPVIGTFWSLQKFGEQPPFPFLPFDVPVYSLGDGVFVFDDRTVDYVALHQEAEAMRLLEAAALGMNLDEMDALESGGAAAAYSYSTNDLWLEITGMSGDTASFVIHPPWTVTSNIYDLYFVTNLEISQPQTWTRILRAEYGQTNLVVTNLPPAQGFFRLGPTNWAIRPGFTNNILDRNDDYYTDLVPIGFSINFFGSNQTNLYVNNNGNVTFDAPQGAYVTAPLAELGIKIIAPFWADVDTRNTDSDVVRYGTNTVDGHIAFGVDWLDVGYYPWQADKLLSCQLVIIERSDIAAGDFDMEFNYDKVEWDWGSASQGTFARAGHSDGTTNSSNSYELPGSGAEGVFFDSNPQINPATGLIYHSLNSLVSGRYLFFFRNGEPLPPLP